MKLWLTSVILIFFYVALLSCTSDSSDTAGRSFSLHRSVSKDKSVTADTGKSFTLNYTFGSYSGSYDNIYVIWAENSDENFYYPIRVCKRLLDGSLTGTVLPYWKFNKYPKMDKKAVDAVSQATIKKRDFSVSFTLPDDAPDEFTLFFETDVYFNDNDWFHLTQPATLYKANIDYNNPQARYLLEFIGWTPNEVSISNEKKYDFIKSVELVFGGLQSETRYITNHKISTFPDVFGAPDDNPQTNLVGSIVVITAFK
jgi:hypothetical protein